MTAPTLKATYDPADSPARANDEGGALVPAGFWPTFKRLYLGVPGILAGVVLGIVIGYCVNQTEPSSELTSWLGILGTLFINAVKCLVGPLVFCSLVVGMADMLAVGKAGKFGSRALGMYVITTVLAACEGLVWVVIFRPLFSNQVKAPEDETPKFALQCEEAGYFMTNVNGTIACVYDATFNSTGAHSTDAIFYATDINGVFEPAASEYTERTLTETLQSQLNTLVPSNITTAFADADLLSIIMFAMIFGVAIASFPKDMKVVASFFREINQVFMTMIQWVITCTPIALVSLLAGVVAEQDDLAAIVNDVGFFVLCSIIGMLVHLWGVYPLLLRIFVKQNPFSYLKHIVPAQVFALSCASSMATLPVTMRCVDATKQDSRTLSRFCLSLGATINMDGATICYPIAIVFMAEAEGLGDIIAAPSTS